MQEHELREKLDEIHHELEHAHDVDSEVEALLRRILEDIRQLIHEPRGETPPEHHALNEQLMDMTYHFESTHPTLAASMRQVAVALGNMGI